MSPTEKKKPTPEPVSPPTCRAIVADDQRILRELLAQTLSHIPGLEVVAQCGDGLEALKSCAELKPDLLVLDIVLPGMSGLEVIHKLSAEQPDIRVLAITGMEDPQLITDVLKAGAKGFIIKASTLNVFNEAVAEVMAGRPYYHRVDLVGDLGKGPKAQPPAKLTRKEIEVLKLLAAGLKAKEAADKLNCSVRTVDNHRANIMKKLQMHDIVSLTHYALRRGLISL